MALIFSLQVGEGSPYAQGEEGLPCWDERLNILQYLQKLYKNIYPPRKHLTQMGIAKWRKTKTFNKAFTWRAVFCRHISDGSTLTRWSGSRDPSHNRFSKYFHNRRILPPPFWHTKIFLMYPQNLSNWTRLPDVLIWRLQNLFKPMRFIFPAGISR